MQYENANALDANGAGVAKNIGIEEFASAQGHYEVKCFRDGKLLWEDTIKNAVCTEGKNAMLTNCLKGSAFTQTLAMGLIESTGYGFAGANGSGVAATNLAGSITAAAGASPANGWNEATSGMFSARGTPSFGTASAGSISLSATTNFTAAGSGTIKGCFVLMKNAAGTAPTTAVGNTNGALWSAGLFSGGDKAVQVNDVLQVSYTTSL